MARTLEQLQTARDAIIDQMSQPVRGVTGNDMVEFRSQQDLEHALAKVDAEIAALSGSQSTVFTIQTSRGL